MASEEECRPPSWVRCVSPASSTTAPPPLLGNLSSPPGLPAAATQGSGVAATGPSRAVCLSQGQVHSSAKDRRQSARSMGMETLRGPWRPGPKKELGRTPTLCSLRGPTIRKTPGRQRGAGQPREGLSLGVPGGMGARPEAAGKTGQRDGGCSWHQCGPRRMVKGTERPSRAQALWAPQVHAGPRGGSGAALGCGQRNGGVSE